jgi:hypothetical protein
MILGKVHFMKDTNSFYYRFLVAVMGFCILLFGVIIPHSLSDHFHLLHFAAHFGMSFLLAHSLYQFSRHFLTGNRVYLFALVASVIMVLGGIYKLIEIFWFNNLREMPFFFALKISGFRDSMCQNFAGILAAFMLTIFWDNIVSMSKINRANLSA